MTETRIADPAPVSAHREWTFLGDAQIDQLAGLVLELAGQLHVERTRISALEHALDTAGVLDRSALDAAAADPALAEITVEQLDRSLAGLVRVMTEGDDARGPLRGDERAEG